MIRSRKPNTLSTSIVTILSVTIRTRLTLSARCLCRRIAVLKCTLRSSPDIKRCPSPMTMSAAGARVSLKHTISQFKSCSSSSTFASRSGEFMFAFLLSTQMAPCEFCELSFLTDRASPYFEPLFRPLPLATPFSRPFPTPAGGCCVSLLAFVAIHSFQGALSG